MSFSVRMATGVPLLIAMIVSGSVSADEAAPKVTKVVRTKSAKAKADKADPPPADALNPSVGVSKAAAKKEAAKQEVAAEAVDLGAITAPFRALFGGVAIMEVEDTAEIVVNVQPAAPADGDPNAENDAMTQQFLQQYRPIMKAELGFVRMVCSDLTPEQRPKIKEPAEAALKQAAKQMSKQQMQMQRGLGVRTNAEPSKLIRDAVERALKETLSEEQLARYTEEANHRTAARKRAAILAFVSRLDGQLYLTAEQRDKITDSLTAKWQDAWEKWLTMMNAYGDRYFPNVPDQCIAPHLNAEQKTVWQGVQKIDYGGWWGGGGNWQNQADDGWWGDEPQPKNGQFNGAGIINQLFGF